MKTYAYIFLALTLLASLKWYGASEYKAGETAERVFWQQRFIESKKDAEKRSQDAQNTLTAAYQVQYDELSNINTNYANDLAELRKRSKRMLEATRATCQGSTGAELSIPDTRFLAGEAARADTIRAGLRACYKYVDVVEKLYR